MTVVIAAIGAKALYLLYAWLASAIIASYLSERKGYGSKVGLAAGLLGRHVARCALDAPERRVGRPPQDPNRNSRKTNGRRSAS